MKDLFYISKSGEVRWNKFPEEPNREDFMNEVGRRFNTFKYEAAVTEYQQALQSAKDSSVLCADQEQVLGILRDGWRILKAGEAKDFRVIKDSDFGLLVQYHIGNQSYSVPIQPDSLHPFPSEQYEVEVIERTCEDSGRDNFLNKVDFEKVAIIKPKNMNPALQPEKKTAEELLIAYSNFLEANSYLDTDWREEKPTSIERFQGTLEPVLNEGKGEDELWTKVISEARFYDGSPKDLVAMREHFKKFYRLISR